MNFTCPYCSQPTTITDPNIFSVYNYLNTKISEKGRVGFKVTAICCPNEECKKLFLAVKLKKAWENGDEHGDVLQEWQLLPESSALVFPEYIPIAICEDYYEACKIKNLSPKASATLARRCIQGMIRDFWRIQKGTLNQEITELEKHVDADTWESIDAVRSVGNIGAHMEKDINLIIDVEPDEAQLLISLIEQLVKDWYIQKHKREERAAKLKALAADKKGQKSKKAE